MDNHMEISFFHVYFIYRTLGDNDVYLDFVLQLANTTQGPVYMKDPEALGTHHDLFLKSIYKKGSLKSHLCTNNPTG